MALVGVVLVASPAEAQLRGPEVTSVRFEGNETFPADSLRRAIVTRETECRSWVFNLVPLCPLGVEFALDRFLLRDRDLPRDRARLILWYRQRGFRDVFVEAPAVSRTPTRAQVSFQIVEGSPVRADSVEFIGAEPFVADGLLDGLPLRPGDRLSEIAMDATRDSIIRRLSNRGHAYAEVFRSALRPAEDPYNAIVTFEIVPGPETRYGDISVSGVENLGVGTVLRTVRLTRGEPYRRDDVDEAARRLYGLEIVRSASVQPDTISESRDPDVDIDISVQEGDLYRVRGGLGWSSAECLSAEARWASRNFFGGGRLLRLRTRVGNVLAPDFRDVLCTQSGEDDFAKLTGIASLEFVQPWIFSTSNALSASLFAERQSLPDIFIRRAVGGQLAVSRTISPQTLLTGFARPEVSQLDADDSLFCTGFLVCTPEDINRLEDPNWLSPVGFSLTQDRSDDLLNPRRGYRVLVDFEHAAGWTKSDFRYDRVMLEATRYSPIGPVVFATRARGGWVGAGGFSELGGGPNENVAIVHPQKRFYTGGANSVRGFAQSRLGPRVLVATPETLLSSNPVGGGQCAPESLEDKSCAVSPSANFVTRPTGGTRLVEANAELRFPVGSVLEAVVFTDAGQAWVAGQEVDIQFTPGFGVRFPSPVGPIRVDLAYRFRGAQDISVVTELIEPYDATMDRAEDRLLVDKRFIDWVGTGRLVLLDMPVLYGANDRGLQLHVSIGQAF